VHSTSAARIALLLGADPLVAGGLDIFMPPLGPDSLSIASRCYQYASDIFDILGHG
jgi:hypothetical protein